MNVLEFLDRAGQRRHERNLRRGPLDSRLVVGAAFLGGYYLLVYGLMRVALPAENSALVRDAFLVLGPAVGLIVGALFRTDKRDEIAANNTGEAFRAQRAQAEATTAVATGHSGDGTNA